MPQVVIVDEIGTEAEALACRTIAERGVVLIGTAHGRLLENLIKNPTLSGEWGHRRRLGVIVDVDMWMWICFSPAILPRVFLAACMLLLGHTGQPGRGGRCLGPRVPEHLQRRDHCCFAAAPACLPARRPGWGHPVGHTGR
jgi:hypothetical protein